MAFYNFKVLSPIKLYGISIYDNHTLDLTFSFLETAVWFRPVNTSFMLDMIIGITNTAFPPIDFQFTPQALNTFLCTHLSKIPT